MSLIEDLVARIAHAIDQGLLLPGRRLPAIRAAALEYGVSKNTVVEAYDRLVARGWLQARRGSGFYVRANETTQGLMEAVAAPHIVEAVDLVSLLREQLQQVQHVRVGDGRPPAGWMEESELGRHLRPSGGRHSRPVSHGYGDPIGFAPLRNAIALMLSERSIKVNADQILITFGANHALDLIIRHLLRRGDRVLVDSPGYYPLFGKLRLAGIEVVGVRRNPDGPDLDHLESQIAKAAPKIFFTQSLAHNPTGSSISFPVAHNLLQIAARGGIHVVEDDPFGDVLPAIQPRLAALDQLGRVICVGTFSKTLSASLRIGYIAASPALTNALCNMKMLTVVNSSGYLEHMVSDLIESGQYRHHLRRLRERIGRASHRAQAALDRVGLGLFAPPSGGYYLWTELPEGTDDLALAARASRHSIFIAPGSVFYPERECIRPGMRINIAYADDPSFLQFMKTERLGA
ncbi:MAG: PLP-dependent aminotransferase family protein [Proteobacteria bacterium]|nr:PLP-dependent aminotransferase family protein [Pseudomonadota bacterium]